MFRQSELCFMTSLVTYNFYEIFQDDNPSDRVPGPGQYLQQEGHLPSPVFTTTVVYSLKSGNRFRETDGKPRDRQIEGKKSKRGERGSYKASARRTS